MQNQFILEKIRPNESESAASAEDALAIVNSLSAEGIPPVIMAAVACCDLGVKYLVQVAPHSHFESYIHTYVYWNIVMASA